MDENKLIINILCHNFYTIITIITFQVKLDGFFIFHLEKGDHVTIKNKYQ